MYKYHCMNPIAEAGLKSFTKEYMDVERKEAEVVLVRSADMHEVSFEKNLLAVARAGAGVNNIPVSRCAAEGIVVFNTPGANANGVKELVIAGMLLASRDIIGGVHWVLENQESDDLAKLAEKQKKAFAGCEIEGKKLGVVGLGAIGGLVANAAAKLGMDVYGFDPFVSVDAAWKLSGSVHHARSAEEIYETCDYITLHVPALDSTKNMIGQKELDMMKDGVVLLNFARDILVEEMPVLDAMQNGKVKRYVTDFPTPAMAAATNAIVIPHLGASTEESEENCAKMAVRQVMDYLENGNIKNSVNYPNCDMGLKGKNTRITILHKNIPNMIGQFTAMLAKENLNISDMTNKSRGEYAYTMIDLTPGCAAKDLWHLEKIDGVLRVRIITGE